MKNFPLDEIVITDIAACNTLTRRAGMVLHKTNRAQCAISCKTSGHSTYSDESREILSDTSHIVFIPAGASYTCRVDTYGVCMMVEFDALPGTYPEEITLMETRRSMELHSVFHQMCYEWTFHRGSCRMQCMADLYRILDMLRTDMQLKPDMRKKQELLAPSIRCIEESSCSETLTCGYLASLSGVSEVYFRRIFRSIYGMAPMEYIRHIRIERAKSLLEGDYGSVTEVAQSVGFGSVYHFSRVFRECTGMSPTEYLRTLTAVKNR